MLLLLQATRDALHRQWIVQQHFQNLALCHFLERGHGIHVRIGTNFAANVECFIGCLYYLGSDVQADGIVGDGGGGIVFGDAAFVEESQLEAGGGGYQLP